MHKLLKVKRAFSLAEAMITMLIVSVTLAAIAPVITRKHDERNCYWKKSQTETGIYYNDGIENSILPVAIGTKIPSDNVPLTIEVPIPVDRKSTRLNSSHQIIS